MGTRVNSIVRGGWDISIEQVFGRKGERYVVRVLRCPRGVVVTRSDFCNQFPTVQKARRHAERLTQRRPCRA